VAAGGFQVSVIALSPDDAVGETAGEGPVFLMLALKVHVASGALGSLKMNR
jgi:hypothetical protein